MKSLTAYGWKRYNAPMRSKDIKPLYPIGTIVQFKKHVYDTEAMYVIIKHKNGPAYKEHKLAILRALVGENKNTLLYVYESDIQPVKELQNA